MKNNKSIAEYYCQHPKELERYLDIVQEIYDDLENKYQQIRALITDGNSWNPEIKKMQDKMKEI